MSDTIRNARALRRFGSGIDRYAEHRVRSNRLRTERRIAFNVVMLFTLTRDIGRSENRG